MKQLIFSVAVTWVSRMMVRDDLRAGRVTRTAIENTPDGHVVRFTLPSSQRTLDAVLVQPFPAETRAVVLLCHGIGEIVEHWFAVQKLLAAAGVASLIFDYGGYGRSSGWITAQGCEQDAVAAFRYLQQRFAPLPVSMLGFSMGSGISVAVQGGLPVHRLVLCSAFTSFQAAVRSAGFPPRLGFLVPPLWPTARLLATCSVPVLIVHGEQDQLFPRWMAEELHAACASRSELMLVPELSHDDLFFHPQRAGWNRIIDHLVSP